MAKQAGRRAIRYVNRGDVERGTGRGYRWHSGYSEDLPGGVSYPWLTKREAQADAKARGGRAVFIEDRKETRKDTRHTSAEPPRKSHAQIKQEVDAILAEGKSSRRHPRNHATINTAHPRFAVEIDPSEFQGHDELPPNARWRDDLRDLAEQELSSGRTYRRPRDARYTVIEWTGPRGALGRLLDWLEGAAGITRYAELFA